MGDGVSTRPEGPSPPPGGRGSTTAGAASSAVRPVDPRQIPDWDARLAGLPGRSFFHTAAWARVLAGAYPFTPLYLAGGGDGGFRALLPLMEVDSWLTGKRGIGLPFTDECPPLVPDRGGFQRLFQGALELGRSRNWKYLECRGGRQLFGEVPASLSFHGHLLALETDEEAQFGRLESSVRRAVRKAGRSGLRVEVSRDLPALEAFYALQCKTRRKHGLPPQPFSFFRSIHRHVLAPGLGIIVTARLGAAPVAASVYFQCGDAAIYKYGASDAAFQELRGANLVMWEAIKWHAQKGFRTLHFGRSSAGNEGLRRFKLGWGAAEETLDYVKYDFRKERFVTDADESRGWHNRVFGLMPAFCARIIGAALYRHIA